MKHFALDLALLFLFGFLAIALRYTGGKGFGVITGEEKKRATHRARGPRVDRLCNHFFGESCENT